MKNIFWNIASLDKLWERLTKKNAASLLILPTIAAVLFAAPILAFAGCNSRDSSSQSRAVSVTPIPSNGSSKPTVPLTSIHMLDKTHGWALTLTSVLKTLDGGLHWQDVTPTSGNISKAFFLNDQDAWGFSFAIQPNSTPTIANTGLPADNLVNVLHTTNGGKSWQKSTIQSGTVTDVYPFFLNASVGWLQTFGVPGMMGQVLSAIFHTTDGGQHWNQLGNANQSDDPNAVVRASGISFIDAQNGWEAGDGTGAAPNPAQPLLDVTHDGGQTWHSLSLPALPGAGKDDMVKTTPPVLFGKNSLLPVQDQDFTPPSSTSVQGIGLDLYVTHNGGQTWTPTKFITTKGYQGPSSFIVYAADIQHVWAASGTNLYATSDSGQNWITLPQAPQPISILDFVDANNGWTTVSTETTPGNINTQQTHLLHTTDGGHTWQAINYSVVGKPKG